MRKRVLLATMALSSVAAFLAAQDQSKQPPTVVVPKKAGSAKEAAAIKKITEAKTDDDRIAAVDALITNFADTAFKGVALFEAAEAADHKQDYAKAVSYGELSIQADPTRFDALILVAGELAQHTGKYDLDKEEKLTKAEKYVAQATTMIPTAAKPQGGVSDSDWDGFKKDEIAAGHKDLGLVAAARSKWDVAATEYKLSLDSGTTPDAVVMARLSNAYNEAGKYTEGLAMANKVLAMPDLNPTVKNFADQEKTRATKALAKK